ncbi:MAG: CotH kinase family protein [Bacteroidota bacterium]
MLLRSFLLVILLTSLVLPSVAQRTTVLPRGSSWRYLDAASAPAGDWSAPGFDDGTWKEGPAEFGYGEGDEQTVIGFGPDAQNKYPTAYFRRRFTVGDTTGMSPAPVSVLFDDGVVVYLNGKEVFRNNMPDGPITYGLFANNAIEPQWVSFQVPLKLVKPGENTLAVEVHQANGSSSDLSFNLEFSTEFAAQVSSNLPLIHILADGVIPDEPKLTATMRIIYNGPGVMNRLSDPPTDYNGLIGIERRGSTSQDLSNKKPYGIELRDALGNNLDTALLGMPREHDWILLAPYSDKTMMRDALAYILAGRMMDYAPRVRFCELYINNTYQGIYILTEKIKQDKGRVDIANLTTSDVSGDELTGGYILKIDKTTGGAAVDGFTTNYGTNNFYQYHDPKATELRPEQKNYIQQVIKNFERVISSEDYDHPTRGYYKLIDLDSFVDFFLINELSRNVDGYRLSSYIYKDKDSNDPRLKMGPVWDFNITFGNADYCEGGSPEGFAVNFNSVCPTDYFGVPFYWKRMLGEPVFRKRVASRWFALRKSFLSTASLHATVDSVATLLSESQVRNFSLYPILNQYVWPNRYVGGSYANELKYLKDWLALRTTYLDAAFNEFLKPVYDPEKYEAPEVYPNPSDGDVNFRYYVRDYEVVEIRIRDASGRPVATLRDELHDNGWNGMPWQKPDTGAGLFFYQVLINGRIAAAGKVFRD